MDIPTYVEPGTSAPVAGVYQELNVLGGLTGRWQNRESRRAASTRPDYVLLAIGISVEDRPAYCR